jgi:hypothetical protein
MVANNFYCSKKSVLFFFLHQFIIYHLMNRRGIMKKTIYFLFLFFLAVTSKSQISQSNPFYITEDIKQYELFANPISLSNNDASTIIDSIHTITGTTIRNHIYKHDNIGNIILDSIGYYSGNQWIRSSKYLWTYDQENRVDTFRIENWHKDGYWLKFNLVTYNYNSYGHLSRLLTKVRKNDEWINRFLLEYFYDSNGIISHSIFQVWNDSTWSNNQFLTYYTNSTGLIDSIQLHTWDSYIGQWKKEGEVLFIYDGNGNLTIQYNNIYAMGEMKLGERTLFTYNEHNKKTSETKQRFVNNQWQNTSKKIYLYNDDNNMIHAESYEWDITNNVWITSTGSFTFAAPTGLELNLTSKSLDAFYSMVLNVEKIYETATNFQLSQNYPNPFNPSTIISYSIPSSSVFAGSEATKQSTFNVTLTVYNALGQKVATLVNKMQSPGNYSVQFSADNLPSGIYFYSLRVNNFSDTKKMLLLK